LARTELQEEEEEVTTAPVEAPVEVKKEGRTEPDKKGKFLIVHPFNWAALWVSPPRPFYFLSLTPPPSQ
jgi:hypothetical protein